MKKLIFARLLSAIFLTAAPCSYASDSANSATKPTKEVVDKAEAIALKPSLEPTQPATEPINREKNAYYAKVLIDLSYVSDFPIGAY